MKCVPTILSLSLLQEVSISFSLCFRSGRQSLPSECKEVLLPQGRFVGCLKNLTNSM